MDFVALFQVVTWLASEAKAIDSVSMWSSLASHREKALFHGQRNLNSSQSSCRGMLLVTRGTGQEIVVGSIHPITVTRKKIALSACPPDSGSAVSSLLRKSTEHQAIGGVKLETVYWPC